MTDKEIIKAFEICNTREDCAGCPLSEDDLCPSEFQLSMMILDLINRQQETIKTLRNCVEQHHIIRKDGKSPLSLLTEEIKAEAIKEYKEQLIFEIMNTPTQKPQYKEALSYFDGTRNRQSQIIEIINGFEGKEMGNT